MMTDESEAVEKVRELYADLLKRSILDLIRPEKGQYTLFNSQRTLAHRILGGFDRILRLKDLRIVRDRNRDVQSRVEGTSLPVNAESMIGLARMDNIQHCVTQVIRDRIEGDLIECGVFRGGATIFMRGILKTYNSPKSVWLADSFEGLPPPSPEKYPVDKGSPYHTMTELAVGLEEVIQNFRNYELYDDQVKILKGFFKDTLPGAPIKTLCLIRVDGDMYESTMDTLTNLFPKLSSGGFVLIDDYDPGHYCRIAVDDFRKQRGISDKVIMVDSKGAYWRKS
jgi:O-methyltransferase